MEMGVLDLETPREQLFRDVGCPENIKAMCADTDRLAERRRPVLGIDYAARFTPSRQFERGGEARRTRPDNQNRPGVFYHGKLYQRITVRKSVHLPDALRDLHRKTPPSGSRRQSL